MYRLVLIFTSSYIIHIVYYFTRKEHLKTENYIVKHNWNVILLVNEDQKKIYYTH